MTDVPLREYIEAIMGEREKRVAQLERDARVALDKAEDALEKRLDLLNEFRQQSVSEQAKFVTRTELQGERTATNLKIDALKEQVDLARGGRAMVMSIAALGVSVAAIAFAFLH